MKYYLIAGERSGDLHGANLIKGIKSNDSEASFRGWGGDLMATEGMNLVTHYKDTAFMGFLEVIKNLGTIASLLKKCKNDLLAHRPDVLILIDYPGFNLRIATFAKKHNIRVFYYISPKVWAWNQKRALKIKSVVDRMFVIFPFEIDFYKQYDFQVDYVGNPLMDQIEAFQPDPDFLSTHQLQSSKIIALLPGSRRQEVVSMLDTMLTQAPLFPDYQFVIAAVRTLPPEVYSNFSHIPNVKVVYEATYDLLHYSEAALVASGTATLETALFHIPEIVCYRTSAISYYIAKRLIRVRFISLVNLIMDREIVKELIQDDFNPPKLEKELNAILEGGTMRRKMLGDYKLLQKNVGGSGASQNAGKKMVDYLKAMH